MAGTNGFFSQLQGPFSANTELFPSIQSQCNRPIEYISQLGVHCVGNSNLNLQEMRSGQTIISNQIFVIINNIEFQIGKTRMLELQDVQITSIKFKQDMDENTFIDYQYPEEEQ